METEQISKICLSKAPKIGVKFQGNYFIKVRKFQNNFKDSFTYDEIPESKYDLYNLCKIKKSRKGITIRL